MSLIVSVGGVYQSYFNPEHMGTLNPKRKEPVKSNLKNKTQQNIQKLASKSYGQNAKHDPKHRVNCFAYEIMTSPVSTISPEMPIPIAMSEMNKLHTHHLLILDGNSIIGLVSDRDLLRSLDEKGKSSQLVKSVMSEKVLLCKRETEIRLIAQIMLEECISCMPVVDDDHVLQGIITRTDLLECIVKNMPLEVWI